MDSVLQEKLRHIKMVIFDVDGIFTDGSVYVDEAGNEMLKFSRIDGMGISLLRKKGIVCVALSRENSLATVLRMQKMRMDEIMVGEKEKIEKYNDMKQKYNLVDSQIAVCGDDIQDLEMVKAAGVSFCPVNAQDEIKNFCDFVSEKNGAQNFARQVCNMILKV